MAGSPNILLYHIESSNFGTKIAEPEDCKVAKYKMVSYFECICVQEETKKAFVMV